MFFWNNSEDSSMKIRFRNNRDEEHKSASQLDDIIFKKDLLLSSLNFTQKSFSNTVVDDTNEIGFLNYRFVVDCLQRIQLNFSYEKLKCKSHKYWDMNIYEYSLIYNLKIKNQEHPYSCLFFNFDRRILHLQIKKYSVSSSFLRFLTIPIIENSPKEFIQLRRCSTIICERKF